jgi:hypothetical protein
MYYYGSKRLRHAFLRIDGLTSPKWLLDSTLIGGCRRFLRFGSSPRILLDDTLIGACAFGSSLRTLLVADVFPDAIIVKSRVLSPGPVTKDQSS